MSSDAENRTCHQFIKKEHLWLFFILYFWKCWYDKFAQGWTPFGWVMGPIYLMIFGFIILLYCPFISFQDIQANDASPHVDIWYSIAPFGGIYTGMIYIQIVLSYICHLHLAYGTFFSLQKASNLQSSISWKSGIFQLCPFSLVKLQLPYLKLWSHTWQLWILILHAVQTNCVS